MRRATSGAGGAQLSGQDGGLRLLEYAIVASIALHLLALAALQRISPRPQPVPAAAAPINARLVEVAAPAPPANIPAAVPPPPSERVPVPNPVAVARPVPEPSGRSQTARKPKPAAARAAEPKAVRKIQARPGPRSDPKAKPTLAPEPRSEVVAKPSPAPIPEPLTASVAPSETPATTPSAGAAAAVQPLTASAAKALAVEEDLIAYYRLQVIGAARRYKRYPRAAMDNQWEGAAVVTMVIGADGRIREMTISHSSGHELLDRQAIDMFRKAKPLVPIPAALRGREFRVMLKAIYSLRDPGA